MNNCTFTGNLGKDAVTRYTQGGKSVTGFSLAVKTGWGDNEKTLWIDCSLWGERGEKLAQYHQPERAAQRQKSEQIRQAAAADGFDDDIPF